MTPEQRAALAAKYGHGQPDHVPNPTCAQCRAEGITRGPEPEPIDEGTDDA